MNEWLLVHFQKLSGCCDLLKEICLNIKSSYIKILTSASGVYVNKNINKNAKGSIQKFKTES